MALSRAESSRVSTSIECSAYGPPRSVPRYVPKAGWAFAPTGAKRQRCGPESGWAARNKPIAARPWYQLGRGGMAKPASSVSSAVIAATSPFSHAAT